MCNLKIKLNLILKFSFHVTAVFLKGHLSINDVLIFTNTAAFYPIDILSKTD